jgi:hypothetical protein
MDEASKLVSELQFKLAELDHKVWKYRRDMASEFDKYAEGLLRDVPKHVSETVSRTVKESMNVYKSLYPDEVESCAIGSSSNSSNNNNNNSTSLVPTAMDANHFTTPSVLPIPTPFRRPEEDKEPAPRSPHEREKEFQGLFTPRYLPLLDDPSRSERRSSAALTNTVASLQSEIKEKEKTVVIMQVDASTDTKSLTNSPQASRPPTPKRRNTDEVSFRSNWSETPIPRSALRRSSTSSKSHSPRRVRFDVEGEEVLPTSSPAAVRSPIADIPGLSFAEETEEEAGSEQIEDIEEDPAPKRISSSQALLALSRSPLEDDGTQWTTVTAPPDGSASVATTNEFSPNSSSEDLQNEMLGLTSVEAPRGIRIPTPGNGFSQGRSAGNSSRTGYSNDEPETPSDDEMLDIMAPLRRQTQSHASMLSPAVPANIDDNKSPTASTRPTGGAWKDLQNFGLQQTTIRDDDLMFDDEQEAMFDFDENVPPSRPVEPQHEDESSESEPELLIKSKKPPSQPSSFSRSPAREIVRPNLLNDIIPPTKGIVGSYKGHPFSMPVVNKEIHDQAASMGAISSFVGSLDGRSGLDAGDALSFSRSGGIGSYSGTPRSMSERLMMDDIMEVEENRKMYYGRGM